MLRFFKSLFNSLKKLIISALDAADDAQHREHEAHKSVYNKHVDREQKRHDYD